MKWNNKSHEFDLVHERIRNSLILEKGVYCFGAGKIGSKFHNMIKSLCNIIGYIDNDKEKIGGFHDGKKVYSLDEILYDNPYIVITVMPDKYSDIRYQLSSYGLIDEKNYTYWEQFLKNIFPIALNYQMGKNYVDMTQISVTERCTLSCINCAHACNYVSINDNDLPLDVVKKSADSFFSVCDYVNTFVLIGGEPLLYKDLASVIDYIGENYRERIYKIQITTNGTIIPTEEIIEKCIKWNVFFLISNYSSQIPKLELQYSKLTNLLKTSGIEFALFPKETEWTDYGFESVERDDNPIELIKVFDACHTECHEVRGEKFYFCVMARSVNENMNRGVGINDYLDLSKLNPKSEEDKRIFMEYSLGFSINGYLEMCKYCNGAERVFYKIPAAVQGKKKDKW